MNDVNNRIFYEFSEFLKETESVPPEMRVSLAYEITIKSTIASALIDLASENKLDERYWNHLRVQRNILDFLYAYDVRHDDECRGIPCEIAPFIMVNHWGTIILTEPLELPDDGRRYIDEETDWNYDPFGGAEKKQKPCTTVAEFMNTYMTRR